MSGVYDQRHLFTEIEGRTGCVGNGGKSGMTSNNSHMEGKRLICESVNLARFEGGRFERLLAIIGKTGGGGKGEGSTKRVHEKAVGQDVEHWVLRVFGGGGRGGG